MQTMIDDFVAAERAADGRAGRATSTSPGRRSTLDQEGLEEALDICEAARLAMAEVERRSVERTRGEEEPSFRVSSIFGLFKIPSPPVSDGLAING